MIRWMIWVLLASLVMCVSLAPAQERKGPRQESGETQEQESDEATVEDEDEDEDAEEDEVLAIVGGRVHTVSGPVLDGATILCRNGRIEAIGMRVSVPEEATVVDAKGHHVYPGLIAMRTLSILSGSNPDEGTDLFSLQVVLARSAGITTALTGNSAAKLAAEPADMVIGRNIFEILRYGTNDPAGRRKLRAGLDRVRDHLRDKREHEEAKRRDPEAEAPDESWLKGEYQKYRRLLKGEATALVDADSTHDLLQLCRLAETYGIRIVARGAYEGWTVAPEMGRAGMAAIVSPRREIAPNDRLVRANGSTIENAAILHRHGVPVALLPAGGMFGPGYAISLGGLAGRDLLNLPMAAAFAVRGGLPEDAAVRGLTLEAARILGVDDRVGSIEVGKDADFVITDGEILHYMTMSRWTIVNGTVVYDRDVEGIFSHIRPDDPDAPVPDDYWPRSLGADW